MEFTIIFLVNRYFHVVILLTKALFVDKITVKGLIVYYVLMEAGGGGYFLKNQVYENFTPPPQKKKNFKQKIYPPLQCQFENFTPPPPLPRPNQRNRALWLIILHIILGQQFPI